MELTEEDIKNRLKPVDTYTIDPQKRQAAVLIPLTLGKTGWEVFLTRRTEVVHDHKGQVSFPGGGVEPRDTSLADTALRECEEEIGLKANEVTLLGSLSMHEAVTGVIVIPFVGVINRSFSPKLEAREVARLFTIPLNWLANPNNLTIKPYLRPDGSVVQVTFYQPYDGEVLWGLSASILQEFLYVTNYPIK